MKMDLCNSVKNESLDDCMNAKPHGNATENAPLEPGCLRLLEKCDDRSTTAGNRQQSTTRPLLTI
jgi:hypothetical protein